jgi:MSHA biogenesis protein MshP
MSAMCPERANHRRQAGFSLVTGIFLLVILAALGAFLVTVSGLFQVSSALDIQGARAYQAARAGIEWGAFQSLRNGVCPAPTNLTFAGTGLADFTTTVTCTEPPAYTEQSATVIVDQISATACNQPAAGACPNAAPGSNYVERQISITVSR